MHTFPPGLNELSEDISRRHGFVQGAGGNVSFKTDDRLWVKASGTRLSDAFNKRIFVGLNLKEARRLAVSSEDFSEAILDEDSQGGLRPSIETSLHSLMPHRWVAHVHSVGLLGYLICETQKPDLQDVIARGALIVDVPYVKPGLWLGKAVLKHLGITVDDSRPAVVLLRNHGLVVASNDVDEVKWILERIEQASRANVLPSLIRNPPSVRFHDWTMIFDDASVTENMAKVLCEGPYTPDEAVFLGAKPFRRFTAASELNELDSSTLFTISESGSVFARPGTSSDAIEIAISAVDFVFSMPIGGKARALSDQEIAELINWDAEKWRKAQER